MENILFLKRVRSKKKYFWKSELFNPYFEMEKISFKEKVYTFLYNLEKTGLTTQRELDWSERMMRIDYSLWQNLTEKFDNDYKEFALMQFSESGIK